MAEEECPLQDMNVLTDVLETHPVPEMLGLLETTVPVWQGVELVVVGFVRFVSFGRNEMERFCGPLGRRRNGNRTRMAVAKTKSNRFGCPCVFANSYTNNPQSTQKQVSKRSFLM